MKIKLISESDKIISQSLIKSRLGLLWILILKVVTLQNTEKKQIKTTCTTSSIFPISNPTRDKIQTNYQSRTISTSRWWRYRQDTTILNKWKHSTPICCRNNLLWWYLLYRSTNVWPDFHHSFELNVCELIYFWDQCSAVNKRNVSAC